MIRTFKQFKDKTKTVHFHNLLQNGEKKNGAQNVIFRKVNISEKHELELKNNLVPIN